MRIKSLEMYGFKSFPLRAKIDFHQGVTAIVGPNGCGKTNILDAFRWILGEHRSSALRGERMEDVIYSGNDDRKPMGMAEVQMCIDNSSGRLAVDYQEVTVTRRYFRGGDSEYFINQTNRCLLRDIQELFMGTGMNAGVYSIIELAQIKDIVGNNKRLRRQLLEEAAGVNKYKSRRKESLNKLQSTDLNISRLGDVIAENERQLRSLKSQRDRALRFQRLKSAEEELKEQSAIAQYQVAQKNLVKQEQKYQQLSLQQQAIAAKSAEHEANVTALRSNYLGQEDRYLEHLSAREQLKEELMAAEYRRKGLAEDLRQLASVAESRKLELSNNTLELSQLKDDLEAQALQHATLSQQESSYAKEAVVFAAQISLQATQLARAETDFVALSAREHVVGRLQLEYQAQVSQYQYTLDTTRVSEQENQQRLIELEAQQRHQTAIISEMQTKQAARIAAGRNAGEQLLDLQHVRTEMEFERGQVTEQKNDLQQRYNRFESQLTTLVNMDNDLVGYFGGVRAVLKMRQKDPERWGDVFGTVVDLISTGEDFEAAIEAAVGGRLQDLVVGHDGTAKELIRMLKQQRVGFATFLPLKILKVRPLPHFRDVAGVIDLVYNLLEFDDRFEKAMRHVFGNVLVMEDIDTAVSYHRAYEHSFRLVTLGGEVVASSGAMTGGKKAQQVKSVLERKRERGDLEVALSNIKLELNRLDLSQGKLGRLLAENGLQLERVVATVQDIKLELSELEFRIRQEGEARTELQSELELRHKKSAGMQVDQDLLAAKLEKKALLLATATQENAQLKEQNSAQRVALNSDRTELQALKDRSHSSSVRLVAARERKRFGAMELAKLGEYIAKLELRIDKLTVLPEQDSQRRHEALGQLSENEQRIGHLQQQLAASGAHATALDEEKKELLVQISQQETAHVEQKKMLDDQLRRELDIKVAITEAQRDCKILAAELSGAYKLELDTLPEVGLAETMGPQLQEVTEKLARLGTVNLLAIEEYREQEERYQSIMTQLEDIRGARQALVEIIENIDRVCARKFQETYKVVRRSFQAHFQKLFSGGEADLVLVDLKNDEQGLDIIACPPGKKPHTITLLSAGEKTLTALALLFGLFKFRPSPFCVLDEVDGPLDDRNTERFLSLLHDFTDETQFVVITHNKLTMERADNLFGVTMEEPGVSRLVSARLVAPTLAKA